MRRYVQIFATLLVFTALVFTAGCEDSVEPKDELIHMEDHGPNDMTITFSHFLDSNGERTELVSDAQVTFHAVVKTHCEDLNPGVTSPATAYRCDTAEEMRKVIEGYERFKGVLKEYKEKHNK